MKRKYIVVLIIILLLFVCAIWSPWLDWDITLSRFLGFGPRPTYAGLKLYSLVGEIDIYVDNEFRGATDSQSSAFELVDISPGVHEIKLVRQSDPSESYFELIRSLNFIEGVDTVVSYELGPTKNYSEGHIFYAEKSYLESSTTKINIISSPEQAKLFIDDEFVGETPLSDIEIDLLAQHKVRLVKDGFDTIEFQIFPETQEARDLLRGYKLNLEINMFLLPLEITTTQN